MTGTAGLRPDEELAWPPRGEFAALDLVPDTPVPYGEAYTEGVEDMLRPAKGTR